VEATWGKHKFWGQGPPIPVEKNCIDPHRRTTSVTELTTKLVNKDAGWASEKFSCRCERDNALGERTTPAQRSIKIA